MRYARLNRAMLKKTGQIASEETHRALELYFDGLGIGWHQIPTCNESRPDYSLIREGITAIAEVKTIACKTCIESGAYIPVKRSLGKCARLGHSYGSSIANLVV